jgi:hypothetical protein
MIDTKKSLDKLNEIKLKTFQYIDILEKGDKTISSITKQSDLYE